MSRFIYLIERNIPADENPYDHAHAMVIIAEYKQELINIANSNCMDEGQTWKDSVIIKLGTTKRAVGLVLAEYT